MVICAPLGAEGRRCPVAGLVGAGAGGRRVKVEVCGHLWLTPSLLRTVYKNT